MPGLQLLELDPDKLFEQFTISEINTVQSSINNEIEKKREELRTLVGERYRDLIEAADTISDMKILSEQVIKDVESMTGALVQLQKRHATPEEQLSKTREKSSVADEITAQLGLLVNLPEVIWTSIDEKEYTKAAQLYLLCRHVRTGFQVEKSLKEAAPNLTILDRQWSALAHFPKTILACIEKDLKEIEVQPKEACNGLVAVALLENTDLLKKLTELRTSSLRSSLDVDDVKKGILYSYSAITSTLTCLEFCFLERGTKETVFKVLEEISNKDSAPAISLVEPDISMKYLSPVIKNFRANPITKSNPTSKEDIKSAVLDWLNFAKDYISKKGKTLLQNVTSLRALHSLTSMNTRPSSDRNFTLRSFSISEKMDLWAELYRPLINFRAKDLITLHWDEAFKNVLEQLNSVLDDESGKKPELDLKWFVWKESIGDLNFRQSDDNNPRGLLLKAKGISPRVAEVCSYFQRKLDDLFNDLSNLCREDVLTSDTKELRSHQQATCLDIILRLKEYVRDIENRSDVTELQLAILARVLQSIPELCPALQKCLTLADDSKVNAWHETKTLLQVESISCWGYWEELIVRRLMKLIPEVMKPPASYADLFAIIPQWEVIMIEEGEEEKVHQSQLNIPSCPSLPLQTLLSLIHMEINKAHVPRMVSENIMQKLVPHLLDTYKGEPLCQAQSLQSLLDVKYIFYQFVTPSNKELSAKCQEKISEIEEKIDPFDLDVSSPYIHANVKSSVHRLHGFYGASPHHGEQQGTQVKISEDPCILTLSKNSPNVWFPPLPVTNPSNRLPIMKAKATKIIGKTATDSTDSSRSTASLFTDWFS